MLVTETMADVWKPNFFLRRFADGEFYVKVDSSDKVVAHRLYPRPEENLWVAFLLGEALYPIAGGLTLLTPYLPYSRMDKATKGEALSWEALLRHLAVAGFERVVSFDVHPLKGSSGIYEGIRVDNHSLGPMLKEAVREKEGEVVFVAPDEGASYLAELHFQKTRRGLGPSSHVELRFSGDLAGKRVCLVDDIIAGGGTMERAVRLALERGAREVVVACVHGLFVGDALERIKEAGASAVYSTDTIPGAPALVSFAQHPAVRSLTG